MNDYRRLNLMPNGSNKIAGPRSLMVQLSEWTWLLFGLFRMNKSSSAARLGNGTRAGHMGRQTSNVCRIEEGEGKGISLSRIV
jgi:hypothetical protein